MFRQVDDFHAATIWTTCEWKTPLRIEAATNDETFFLDLGRGAADLAVDAIQVATDDER